MTAVDEVTTLSMSHDDMWNLFDEHGIDTSLTFSNMTKCTRFHLIREAHPALKSLTDDEMEILLSQAKTQTYKQWETVLRKGERIHSLSLLQHGRCIEYDGNAESLMELANQSVECIEHTRPGEAF